MVGLIQVWAGILQTSSSGRLRPPSLVLCLRNSLLLWGWSLALHRILCILNVLSPVGPLSDICQPSTLNSKLWVQSRVWPMWFKPSAQHRYTYIHNMRNSICIPWQAEMESNCWVLFSFLCNSHILLGPPIFNYSSSPATPGLKGVVLFMFPQFLNESNNLFPSWLCGHFLHLSLETDLAELGLFPKTEMRVRTGTVMGCPANALAQPESF